VFHEVLRFSAKASRRPLGFSGENTAQHLEEENPGEPVAVNFSVNEIKIAHDIPLSNIDADLPKMGALILITDRISEFRKSEATINHRLQSDRVSASNHFDLVDAATDDDTLQARLFAISCTVGTYMEFMAKRAKLEGGMSA
jgi:hypothetical protein